MKMVHVVGARPNFMKAAPVYGAFSRYAVEQILVHTGQHYHTNMSEVFFQDLHLPPPDVNLGVGSGSHAKQTAEVMIGFEQVVIDQQPDWVMVYGDVNSTVAAALVCAKFSIPLAHVEAGLRSFDRRMPEEINRLLTDQISTLLFTPSEDGNTNLLREGVAEENIHLVGNVMIDSLLKLLPKIQTVSRASYPDRYGLVTLHRPSNVDNNDVLLEILRTLARISASLPIVFPVHPRTKQRIASLSATDFSSNIHFIEPIGYIEFLSLQQNATVVITDSGGIQEETTFLGIPCLTLRENTERPITIDVGTNILIGSDYDRLIQEVDAILAGKSKKGGIPPLWDGRAAERIAEIVVNYQAGL